MINDIFPLVLLEGIYSLSLKLYLHLIFYIVTLIKIRYDLGHFSVNPVFLCRDHRKLI